jgi:uncharacterized membrane protein
MDEHHGAFGGDTFGRLAERSARFFGTPQYIVFQTLIVIAWIVLNSIALVRHWDPYPFILLNLAFSTQAAYAAPLILLAETRQAERDKRQAELDERRHEALADAETRSVEEIKRETDTLLALLDENTRLTKAIHELVARR